MPHVAVVAALQARESGVYSCCSGNFFSGYSLCSRVLKLDFGLGVVVENESVGSRRQHLRLQTDIVEIL